MAVAEDSPELVGEVLAHHKEQKNPSTIQEVATSATLQEKQGIGCSAQEAHVLLIIHSEAHAALE